MRKIAAVELAALVATMAIGSAHSYDESPEIFNLATVTVTGRYYPQNNFYWTNQTSVNPYYPPGGSSTPLSTVLTEKNRKGLNCAKQYTNKGLGAGKGGKPGYRTYITQNRGWRTNSKPYGYQQTRTAAPPTLPGGPWVSINGVTFPGGTTSYIFGPAITTTADMVETIAHEWAHQWGASDNSADPNMNAYSIGAAAKQAFLNDNGSKCGGL